MAFNRRGAWFLLVYFLAVILGLCLLLASCTHYNPALYVSYDILNPGPDVRKNPISITEDPVTHESLFIVNAAFLLWVNELKQEILSLRKGK
jgi:hypothetical protein